MRGKERGRVGAASACTVTRRAHCVSARQKVMIERSSVESSPGGIDAACFNMMCAGSRSSRVLTFCFLVASSGLRLLLLDAPAERLEARLARALRQRRRTLHVRAHAHAVGSRLGEARPVDAR